MQTTQEAAIQHAQQLETDIQPRISDLPLQSHPAIQAGRVAEPTHPAMESLMARALIGDNFPSFHADPNIDPLFEDFLTDYELACEAYGIDPGEKKARFLSSRLKGYALEAYKHEVKEESGLKDDYGALIDKLAERFARLFGNRRTGTTNFYSRNQREGESVVSYFHELGKLAKHAYPGERMPDSQFLERLLRGMLPWLKHKVVAKEVKTSQEALEAAVTIESNKAYLDEDKRIAVAATKPASGSSDNKELEKKVDKLSSAINQISAHLGENPYSRQQRMAKPRQLFGQAQPRRWPNPQHHFPGRTFQQPRPSQGRRSNYNNQGQQRCYSCRQLGHFIASRPNRNPQRDTRYRPSNTRSQPRPGVRAVAVTNQDGGGSNTQTPTRSSSAGGSVLPSLFLYSVTLICIAIAPAVSGQRPTICDTSSPGQLIALPTPDGCFLPNSSVTAKPVGVAYDLYRYNHIQYDVGGWLCRVVYSQARLKTYFFGDEHLQEFSSQEVLVSPEECRNMASKKMSAYGELHLLESGT